MSHAVHAQQAEVAKAPGVRATPQAGPGGMRVSEPGDALEQEADHVADEVMAGNQPKLDWSLSRMGIEAPLQRKCAAPMPDGEVPAAVNEALRSPAQPLERPAQAEAGPLLGHDLSSVRIHTDAEAAESAEAVSARAYTVGNHVVFGRGQYRTGTDSGRRLLIHELAHVVQQQRLTTSTLQRQANPDEETGGGTSLWSQAFALADESRWEQVAELVNGFSPEHLSYFIQTFKGAPGKISYLYLGAIGNKKVGPESAVAIATTVTYLDFNFREEIRKGDWSRAAKFINAFNAADIRARLSKLDSEKLKALHTGASENPELGVESAAAKLSAEILAARSAQGDTKALLLPTITGKDKDDLVRVMRVIDGIRPSAVASGLFTITVDGQPENLTAAQAADIRKKSAGVLKEHLQRVEHRASSAVNSYNTQSDIDRQHWLVAPIVKFVGRVKDPGPDLLAYGARAHANVVAAYDAINAGNLTQAAMLLAGGETAAVSAMKMWQAYFQGIISAGEMTVTALEITRDAAFLTLGILATIATGGAAAGALGAAEGTAATTTAFGVELGVSTTTAANVIAVGAPIVANLAEAAAKVSMGDKVDWGALVIDTAVQIVIARFGGKVTGGITKALLCNPATESLASRVTEKVVHAAIMHAGSTALMTAAQDAYRLFQGQDMTWEKFIDELIARLTDPKSLAIIAVTGALTSAAEAKFGGPRVSPVESPPTVTSVHEAAPEPPVAKPPVETRAPAKPPALSTARPPEAEIVEPTSPSRELTDASISQPAEPATTLSVPPGPKPTAPVVTETVPSSPVADTSTGGEVIPISSARKGVSPPIKLQPAEREVTSLTEYRQRQQATTEITQPPSSEPQSHIQPAEAENVEAQEFKIAAGAEASTPSVSEGSVERGSNREPTVASARRGGKGDRPRQPIAPEYRTRLEVVEDIAQFQPASREQEPLLEELGERPTPGGPEPRAARIGNWADKHFEQIEDIILPHAADLVSEPLPKGLEDQHTIKGHPLRPRPDRVDRERGIVYEIKPRSRYRQGKAEAEYYADQMDKYEPLPNGRRWQAKCVTYDMAKVGKFLAAKGYLP